MSFLSRAQKSYDRGDKVRAVVTLIEGLKRAPDDADAVEFLLALYGIEVDGLGLENDVIRIVELQHDAADLLSVLVDNARGCGHERVAETLLELGEARGIRYVPPTRDTERHEAGESPDSGDSSDAADPGDPTNSAEPGRSAEAGADDPPAEPGSVAGDAPDNEDSPLPEGLLADIDQLDEQSVPEADEYEPEEPASDTDTADSGTDTKGEASKPPRRTAKRSRRTEGEGTNRPLRKRYIFIVFVACAIFGVVYFGYREVQHVTAIASAEAAIATAAPHRLDELEARLDTIGKRWRGDDAVQSRIAFGRAYAAWASGRDVTIEVSGDESWDSGASAIAAAQAGDLEEALEMVTRAERNDASALPALMARAIVEESRMRWSASDRAWASVVERDPDVLAGYEGRARVAWRRLDDASLQRALDPLQRRDENHPYRVLNVLAQPFGTIPERTTVAGDTEFLRALGHFRDARAAHARGDIVMARSAAFSLAEIERSGVAALQQGVILAASYEADDATAAFERTAMTDGINRALRTRLQATAAEALTGIGRPDLSERFETPIPAKTARAEVEKRLPALRRSAMEDVRDTEWASRALYAHVAAVADRGDVARATELYEHLESREVEPERARWEAALLKLSTEKVRAPSGLEPDAAEVWRAADAFFRGDFEEVNAKTTLPTQGPLGEAARRFQVSSLVATRRVPVALQLLEEERGDVSPVADGLLVRAWARRGRDNQRFVTLYESLTRVEPVGMRRLADLAAAAFWQGRPKEAEAFADAALALNEGHREANWIKGLLLRQRSQFSDADRYLRRSGRDWDDSSGLLVELGHVNMGLENWEEARKNFYRAFLLNRENIEAMRGLGEVYAVGSSDVGMRDLSRISDGLPTSARFAPVRGEVLRWLAVLEGVREGNEAALSSLEAAIKEVGRRPDLLVEMARYHEAKNERAEARKLYALALQGNTTLASAHLGLARTALRDGDESVARDHLERFLEVEPRGDGSNWARKRLEALGEKP